MYNLCELLRGNPYPGRGIVLGCSGNGQHALILYFIMGRSENSRNRVFTEKDGGIITQAANPDKLSDPSLIIYAPVRRHGQRTIVTNGDQTDTIYSCLDHDVGFEEALHTRTFEPDAPNYTPRISGLITLDFKGFSYKMSILKSAGGNARSLQRMFFEYPQPLAGQGHFIHTYDSDGDPLPSFSGEPKPVALTKPVTNRIDLDAFAQDVWSCLNEENKVSLFARAIHLDGMEETCIINKYKVVS